jgi:hypothetical protein
LRFMDCVYRRPAQARRCAGRYAAARWPKVA